MVFYLTHCFTILSLLVTYLLSQECTDSRFNLDKNKKRFVMQGCMAQCLDLTKDDVVKKSQSPCKFDALTGKALGDPCTEDFVADQVDKTVGCQFNPWPFALNWPILSKVCDYVVFHNLLQWKNKVLIENPDIMQESKPFIEMAKEKKVKAWVRLGSDVAPDVLPKDWSEIASDATLRKSVSKSIGDFVKTYDLDGVYIHWWLPGCPGGGCKPEFNKDRAGGISLFKELSAVLHGDGRTITFMMPLVDTDNKRLTLGPDFHTTINKYTNFTMIQSGGQFNTYDEVISYPRNVPKMAAGMKAIANVVGPGLKKKAILTRDLTFYSVVLLTPSQNTINAKFNKDASRRELPLKEVCVMFRKNTYTIKRNVNNQHYAYSNLSLVFYEDIDSIKAEINEVVRNSDMAGVYLEYLFLDDLDGGCGAGRMPFARMYAEALKGGRCVFKPIY